MREIWRGGAEISIYCVGIFRNGMKRPSFFSWRGMVQARDGAGYETGCFNLLRSMSVMNRSR